MAQTRYASTNGSLPWQGQKSGGRYDKPQLGPERTDHRTEVLKRRTPAEQDALLEELLEKYRAQPPKGFPVV